MIAGVLPGGSAEILSQGLVLGEKLGTHRLAEVPVLALESLPEFRARLIPRVFVEIKSLSVFKHIHIQPVGQICLVIAVRRCQSSCRRGILRFIENFVPDQLVRQCVLNLI